MGVSNAIPANAMSRTLGYALGFRDTQTAAAGVMPVRIAVLSPITATTTAKKVENATPRRVLDTFGNCPAVEIVRILNNNTRVAVDVIAVGTQGDDAPTAASAEIGFSGTATEKGALRMIVNGTEFYEVSIAEGDTAVIITTKLRGILPLNAAAGAAIYRDIPTVDNVPVATKTNIVSSYTGVLANDITVQISLEAAGVGMEFDGVNVQGDLYRLKGAEGNPVLTRDYLEETFGDVWYSIVVNPFGENAVIMTALKEFNGNPSEDGGNGRWNAQIVKPFIALAGTSRSNFEAMTTFPTTGDDLTNALCPAPNAVNTPGQIAASYAALFATRASAKPHLDISGQRLPVLALYGDNIGEMEVYDRRDDLVRKGISTCTYDRQLRGYVVQDFVTFRAMPDQNPMARDWNYCRNIMLDFNIAFNYQILQARTLLGRVIVKDDEIISSAIGNDVIRLSVWKAAVINFFTQMVALAYITDQEYSDESLIVELSGTNPKRINTQFAYKRTETVSIASTTAYAGFSFGEEI
jgi:phage tail sheath gpL-like